MTNLQNSSAGSWPSAGDIEMVAIDQIKPRRDNPRTHSKTQIEKIAASIRKYGFTNPILIDEHNQILAGHGRLAAARTTWLDRVPCRRLVNLTEAEKRAYIIADNKLALDAGWDIELLSESLGELGDLNFDLALTGFDSHELDAALTQRDERSTRKARAGEDDLPPRSESAPISQLGDIWLLGRHRMICGDARDPDVIASVMDGHLADLVFTDPPYNVPINGHVSGMGKVQHAEFAMASGEMSEPAFAEFLSQTLQLSAQHCRDGAIAFICMDWRHIGDLIAVGRAVFSEFKNLCVWNKTNAGMGTFYRSKHELVAVFKVGTAPHTNTFGLGDTGRYRTNVWSYAGVNSFSADRMEQLQRHPTSKPVALVADAIRDVSHRGEVVLDMFAGSGTTLIAAHTAGRTARLIEIAPEYCDATIRRWQILSGKAAVLQGTDQTFEDVQSERRGEDK
jgi:DNA modification methylase